MQTKQTTSTERILIILFYKSTLPPTLLAHHSRHFQYKYSPPLCHLGCDYYWHFVYMYTFAQHEHAQLNCMIEHSIFKTASASHFNNRIKFFSWRKLKPKMYRFLFCFVHLISISIFLKCCCCWCYIACSFVGLFVRSIIILNVENAFDVMFWCDDDAVYFFCWFGYAIDVIEYFLYRIRGHACNFCLVVLFVSLLCWAGFETTKAKKKKNSLIWFWWF